MIFEELYENIYNKVSIKGIYKIFQALVPIFLFIGLTSIVYVDLKHPYIKYFYWELVGIIGIIALLPYIPYISTVRFRETEIDMSESEWINNKAKLGSETVTNEEGDKITRERESYD